MIVNMTNESFYQMYLFVCNKLFIQSPEQIFDALSPVFSRFVLSIQNSLQYAVPCDNTNHNIFPRREVTLAYGILPYFNIEASKLSEEDFKRVVDLVLNNLLSNLHKVGVI